MVKGAVPAAILGPWSNGPAWFTVALGLAAVLGHIFSPYVRFRGGKGVATAAGTCLALVLLAIVISLVLWAVTLWLSGYVSVVSRSEEHTSELQSPYDIVCRLLLDMRLFRH